MRLNMLVYNKYLKELGYKKSDFSLKKKDARYDLNKEYGVVEAQTWELDNTIVLELYTYLRYFQDECPKGIPGGWIDESKEDDGLSDWRNALDEMIKGLRAYWQAENLESSEYKTYEEEKAVKDELYAQFDKAWKLLGDNLRCLWW